MLSRPFWNTVKKESVSNVTIPLWGAKLGDPFLFLKPARTATAARTSFTGAATPDLSRWSRAAARFSFLITLAMLLSSGMTREKQLFLAQSDWSKWQFVLS